MNEIIMTILLPFAGTVIGAAFVFFLKEQRRLICFCAYALSCWQVLGFLLEVTHIIMYMISV